MIETLTYKPAAKKITLSQAPQRIQSIDILRGIVMLIMALDHVRDFFHINAFTDSPTNLATTTPLLFFTRWVTHFCAPVFLFLSGTSAFITGTKKTKKELSIFLIKRGLWLILVEITVITFSWSFNPFYNSIFLQVIWAIGCSMVILGLLVRTSVAAIIVTGCLLFFGHNILDYIQLPKQGIAGILWNVFFTAPVTFYPVGEDRTIVLMYAILPWTSIMLLGYAFGYFYKKEFKTSQRRKILILTGFALTALFIVLRLNNQYGDPAPWSHQKNELYTAISFLNVTKYPSSLQYGCITLGPALIFLALTEQIKNRFTSVLTIYGRVSFFYYVCHFFLIHILCVIFFFASGYGCSQIIDRTNPFLFYFRPTQFGFNLWFVYAIWIFVIAALYLPCKWFDKYKSRNRKWWLSYV